jgi:hypothetical protein
LNKSGGCFWKKNYFTPKHHIAVDLSGVLKTNSFVKNNGDRRVQALAKILADRSDRAVSQSVELRREPSKVSTSDFEMEKQPLNYPLDRKQISYSYHTSLPKFLTSMPPFDVSAPPRRLPIFPVPHVSRV